MNPAAVDVNGTRLLLLFSWCPPDVAQGGGQRGSGMSIHGRDCIIIIWKVTMDEDGHWRQGYGVATRDHPLVESRPVSPCGQLERCSASEASVLSSVTVEAFVGGSA